MIVNNKDQDNIKTIGELDYGSAFKYGGTFYVKTDEENSTGNRKCMHLSSGILSHFNDDCKVSFLPDANFNEA